MISIKHDVMVRHNGFKRQVEKMMFSEEWINIPLIYLTASGTVEIPLSTIHQSNTRLPNVGEAWSKLLAHVYILCKDQELGIGFIRNNTLYNTHTHTHAHTNTNTHTY